MTTALNTTLGDALVVVPAQAAGTSPAGGGIGSTFLMMAVILGIFYFLLIRPQQKEQKAHQALLGGLKAGDRVVTASGLHGKVHRVGDAEVVIEVSDKVRLTVDKVSIKRRLDAPADKE